MCGWSVSVIGRAVCRALGYVTGDVRTQRQQVALAFLIAVCAQASLPPIPPIPLDSAVTFLVVLQQIVIGVSLGFAVRDFFLNGGSQAIVVRVQRNGAAATITLPTATATQFDYEVELVIVFGRECRNVSEADALNYVAGYCTGNDFSARDMQYLTSQFMIGKTFDGFAPLGPYLVTSDLVGDPNRLRLECRVNGEQRQDWNAVTQALVREAGYRLAFNVGDAAGTPQGWIVASQRNR